MGISGLYVVPLPLARPGTALADVRTARAAARPYYDPRSNANEITETYPLAIVGCCLSSRLR